MAFVGLGILWLLIVLISIGGLVIMILHLVSMMQALNAVPQPLRRMEPGMVWLNLIPFFGIVWQFMVVNAVADSLRAELTRRNLPRDEDRPGYNAGLISCIMVCCCIIPFVNFIAIIVAIIFRLVHLQKVNGYRRQIEGAGFMPWEPQHMQYAAQQPGAYQQNYQPNYGQQQYQQPYGQQYNQQQNYGQQQNQQPNYGQQQNPNNQQQYFGTAQQNQQQNPPPQNNDPNNWTPPSQNPAPPQNDSNSWMPPDSNNNPPDNNNPWAPPTNDNTNPPPFTP